ncbi:1-acyl-sn-glycerol-3-phosphate acyltransferase [Paracoccus marcusii]|uniref:1-acyl-sn-glycerol-3-phosphate acyltransferase n=1 Tax=Paracoccus marcusii TaxID=59779 RepID=UPI002ED5223A|nr:1-acyl-sn-glycerol-3-phosphate acyltransferase [Paracoccus marcusii]
MTDTHFVTRDPKLARAQALEFAERIRAGHRLLFFPEGTSSDGRRVLPFSRPCSRVSGRRPARRSGDPAGQCRLSRAAGAGPAILWLVGGHGSGAAPAVDSCGKTPRACDRPAAPRFPSQETTARPFRQHAILR